MRHDFTTVEIIVILLWIGLVTLTSLIGLGILAEHVASHHGM